MDATLKDVIFTFRGLRRNPGFALVTIGTIALGIGACTAIFTVVNAVVGAAHAQRARLPFPIPDVNDMRSSTTSLRISGMKHSPHPAAKRSFSSIRET